jgi:hypothetical protein
MLTCVVTKRVTDHAFPALTLVAGSLQLARGCWWAWRRRLEARHSRIGFEAIFVSNISPSIPPQSHLPLQAR